MIYRASLDRKEQSEVPHLYLGEIGEGAWMASSGGSEARAIPVWQSHQPHGLTTSKTLFGMALQVSFIHNDLPRNVSKLSCLVNGLWLKGRERK